MLSYTAPFVQGGAMLPSTSITDLCLSLVPRARTHTRTRRTINFGNFREACP